MLQYKCIVEKINLNSSQIVDDKDYWTNEKKYNEPYDGKFMSLKLIEQVSNNQMKLINLKAHGLKAAPRGPMQIKDSNLLKYIETYFTDNNQSDFFPEMVKECDTENEGVKKTIIVNKYERSSKARENAVKFHGLNCIVCDLNFKEMYGEIGEDFIHIHHLIPIHKIGQNYKINYKKDLVPVCPNCHSMLHRKFEGKEPTIEQLKQMIDK